MSDSTAVPNEVPPVSTPWYLDKAVYAMVLTPLLLALNARFGIPLSPATEETAMIAAVAFIIAHKGKTAWLTGLLIKGNTAALVAAADPGDPAAGLGAVPRP